jgi:hypothetical protein
MTPIDLLTGLAALVLTLCLLTYLIGDNPFYRLASHLFIGVTAGYVTVLAWYAVIEPQLVQPLLTSNVQGNLRLAVIEAIGLLGGLFLLLKSVHVAGRVGTLFVALMVGVGIAVAVGGGLTGTLIPQAAAAMVPLFQPAKSNWPELTISALFTIIGTLATLGFFYYGGRAEPGSPVDRPTLVKPVAAVGQVFIGAAFGMLYAGALAASVAIFAARIGETWGFVSLLFK